MIKNAKDLLMEAQNRQAKYANEHRRYLEFKVGDQVLLSTRNIIDIVDKQHPSKKLTPKYIRPFTITNVISSVTYKLDLPPYMKIYTVFHISLLKIYNPNDTEEFLRSTPPPAIIIPETEEEKYEVETILDKRIIHDQPQYLVK